MRGTVACPDYDVLTEDTHTESRDTRAETRGMRSGSEDTGWAAE